ncbi:DEKNAAC104973 [Brettanomyces naardenensis]|uniref:DEKNAAC104973 n=1 Tax=Brettanomyces naardenensis TaxID=13370 RepID=A0A448YSB9_BRENA|nr:DEKNAAC104973 [Brettanomyces naardenensis]
MSFFRRSSKDKTDHKISKVDMTTIRNGNTFQSLNAPSEVVQATTAYIAQRAGELSFNKGDFFHVVSRPDDSTIEVQDPIRNLSGTVPASSFKFFEKPQRAVGSRSASTGTMGTLGSSNTSSLHSSSVGSYPRQRSQSSELQSGVPLPSARRGSSGSSAKHMAPLPSLYGVVQFDFKAERPDELDVNAGDSVILCAHHEYEWFIGKFLNKIGEPGLIPVSYVQLYDINTKVPCNDTPRAIIEKIQLPTVDEWKAIKNRHKASVRPVGPAATFEGRSSSTLPGVKRVSGSTTTAVSATRNSAFSTGQTSLYAKEVNIESFSPTNGKYWYLVRVVLSDGSTRCLCRYYEDFFNYHQRILAAWPQEGGKYDSKDHKERIIPFIPGPVMDVSESLCHRRMVDLDMYLRTLRELPEYISRSVLVNSFYDTLEGDQQLSYNDVTQDSPIRPTRPPPNMIILNGANNATNPGEAHPHGTYFAQTAPTPSYPVSRNSQSQRDRASQYGNSRQNSLVSRLSGLTLNHHGSSRRLSSASSSSSSAALGKSKTHSTSPSKQYENHSQSQSVASVVGESTTKLKLKFYYKDDIFAIAVPENIKLASLKKLIVPRIDECNEPEVNNRLKVIPKDVNNVDQFEYLDEDILRSDSQLRNSASFVDKGKFLVIV